MKTIQRAELRAGDVLLSLGDSVLSQGIADLDGGAHSHAAIWSGADVIESTLPCAKRTPLEDFVAHAHCVDVLRHRASAGLEPRIVECAGAYLGRPYAAIDLTLATLVLSVCGWLPEDWSEMNALYGAGQLARLLKLVGLLRHEDQDERVTCAELVARAHFNAGCPLTVKLHSARRFSGATFVPALRDLAQRWQASRAQTRELTLSGPSSEVLHSELERELEWLEHVAPSEAGPEPRGDDWRSVRAEWERQFGPPAPATRAYQAPVEFLKAAQLVAGRDWAPGLVSPRQLATSPTLVLLGRLFERSGGPSP